MKKLIKLFSKISLGMMAFLGLSANINAQCAAGQVEVFIDVTTDAHGYEVYWELAPVGTACGAATGVIFSGGNTVVGCSGGGAQAQLSNPNLATDPSAYGNSGVTTEPQTVTGFCLTVGQTYQIIATDDYGDGGTCFSNAIQGFNFCMPTGSANDTFTFTVV